MGCSMANKNKRRVFHAWYSEFHAKCSGGHSEWRDTAGCVKAATFVTLQPIPGQKEYDYSDRVYMGPVHEFVRRVPSPPASAT